MADDYKKQLNDIENKEKLKTKLIWLISTISLLLLFILNFFYQKSIYRESILDSQYGVIQKTIGYYQSRVPYKCVIQMEGSITVEAICFQSCVAGQKVRINKIHKPFNVVVYEVLSC